MRHWLALVARVATYLDGLESGDQGAAAELERVLPALRIAADHRRGVPDPQLRSWLRERLGAASLRAYAARAHARMVEDQADLDEQASEATSDDWQNLLRYHLTETLR